MDAYDEILGLCRARDAKRKEIEQSKKTKEITSEPKIDEAVKAKTSKPVQKPLTYEELMKRAESNVKNTLSINDLKAEETPIEKSMKSNEFSMKNNPMARSTQNALKSNISQKKPVKVIKRNMQPRSEVSDLVTLNQKKRDLRSIEQIQFELKQQAKIEKKPTEKPVKVDEDPEKYYAKNYSSIISNLFGYDKNKYAGADEDDLSDMEADYKTVLAEEARSSRLGREEDLEEEAKEMERKRKKAALLKEQKK